MAAHSGTWVNDVVEAVRTEHPNATLITKSESTDSVIIQLSPSHIFKVPSPERRDYVAFENDLIRTLKNSSRDDFEKIFVPVDCAVIGGYEGWLSPHFDSTLKDLVWNEDVDSDLLEKNLADALNSVIRRLERLQQATVGGMDARFAEELRLTLGYIHDHPAIHSSCRRSCLPRLARMIDAFLPTQGSWCHRDLHLENIAFLEHCVRLHDPMPTLSKRKPYLECIAPLKPPVVGHIFLDYAKLLISLEREAEKLKVDAGRRNPNIEERDSRARSDARSDMIRRCRRVLEQRIEAEVGRPALHLGYVISYGLYATCKCHHCLSWGIWDPMVRGLERAINALLADHLAMQCSDDGSFRAVHGGHMDCLIYELPYKCQRAILKVDSVARPQDFEESEIAQNLRGYATMPVMLRPAILKRGRHEDLMFAILEHAGESLYDRLVSPHDLSFYRMLEEQLEEAYCSTAHQDARQTRRFYHRMIKRFRYNLEEHIRPKHGIDIGEGLNLLSVLDQVPGRALPGWCFWTTTDFTVDNLFYKDGRLIFIDPKDSTPGIFEIDLGMFPTLIEIYSRNDNPEEGDRPPIHESNARFYRKNVFSFACALRKRYEPVDSRPYLALGEAWQYVLSSRFRRGQEAIQLYRAAIASLRRSHDLLRIR